MALISFDLDGVLQRNPFHAGRPDGVFGHIKRELAPHVGGPDLEAAAAMALKLVIDEHQTRLHAGQLVEAHDWDDIVHVVGVSLGYPGRMNVAALVTEYCERPELAYLYPGSRECLETLAAQGHTLVSITNGFESYQAPVLRKLGVLHLFQALITPDAVKAAKPQSAIFQAAEALGGPPRIHVGDVLPHDIAGAKRAGWQAIYIVQEGAAPVFAQLPAKAAKLPPHLRPAASHHWLEQQLRRDRAWHGHPPAELPDCMPDAIVTTLHEVPAAVAALLEPTGPTPKSGRRPS